MIRLTSNSKFFFHISVALWTLKKNFGVVLIGDAYRRDGTSTNRQFFRMPISTRKRQRIRSSPLRNFLVRSSRVRIRRERVRSSFRSAAIICIVRFSTSVLTHQMASDTIETPYRRNGLVEIYDLHRTESYFSAAFSHGKNENRRRSTSNFDAKRRPASSKKIWYFSRVSPSRNAKNRISISS